MATITRRKVHGRVYYYLVESKRIDGKPRLVLQKYLGRAEDVVERLKGTPPTPHTVTVGEYGGSRILWAMARRLRLVEWIDAAAPKRTQGLSVGTYLWCWPRSIASWRRVARRNSAPGIVPPRCIMIARSATRT